MTERELQEELKIAKRRIKELEKRVSDIEYEWLIREIELEIEYEKCEEVRVRYKRKLRKLIELEEETEKEEKVVKEGIEKLGYNYEETKKLLSSEQGREKLSKIVRYELYVNKIETKCEGEKEEGEKEETVKGEVVKEEVVKGEVVKEEVVKGEVVKGAEIKERGIKMVGAKQEICEYIKGMSFKNYVEENTRVTPTIRGNSVFFSELLKKYYEVKEANPEVIKGLWKILLNEIRYDVKMKEEVVKFINSKKNTQLNARNVRSWTLKALELEARQKEGRW